MDIQSLVDNISKLSLVEAAELSKALKEKLGIEAISFGGGGGGGGAAAAAAAPAAVEQTEFSVELSTVAGDKKINVIKAVREITGLGLGEAKALVEAAPKMLPGKEGIAKAEAEEIKKKLTDAGATVTLK